MIELEAKKDKRIDNKPFVRNTPKSWGIFSLLLPDAWEFSGASLNWIDLQDSLY
jgi:hypothetical protein